MPPPELIILEKEEWSLDELDGAARVKAIEEVQRYLYEVLDLNEWKEQEKQSLTAFGFHDIEVWCSLGHCQGDGACFEGRVDVAAWCKATNSMKIARNGHALGMEPWVDFLDNTHAQVERRSGSHYCHWNTMEVSITDNMVEDGPEVQMAFKQLDEELSEWCKSYARVMESRGYEEIDSQTSEDSARDYAIANESRFTEDGLLL
jgi:hypothetical protein